MNSDNKLGQCQICNTAAAKYKCPGCEINTCSLPCVKNHKMESDCTGERDRTKMVARKDMDNLTLLNDYRFLEEIDHKLEDGLRNPLRKSITRERETIADLPFHLKKLKLEAKRRGTVLEYMPKHFSVHKENSTRFLFADKKISWHVKWMFPQADLTFTEKSVDENTILIDLLQKYMEPPNRIDNEPSSLSSEELEKLVYYQSASYHRIKVLLKSNFCKYDKNFVEMDLSKSLRANFVNRKVVEYPVFYVVLRDHLDFYLNCDDDDEEMDVTEDKSKALQDINEDLKKKLQIKKPMKEKDSGNRNFFETFSDESE